MDLRLYKNCRLSSNYDESFYPRKINGTLPHVAYLATLQHADVELDEMYLTREGVLSFSWDYFGDGPISAYNYLRLSDANMTIYAFITATNYVDEIATVSYTTDLWNTYAPEIILGDSIMTATRYPRSDRARSLPLAYVSNRWPSEIASNTSGNVGAIVQYQYFDLASEGADVVTYRNIATALLTLPSAAATGSYVDVVNRLLDLVARSSQNKISTATTSHYYEVGAAWILPAEWIAEIQAEITAAGGAYKTIYDANESSIAPTYRLYDMQNITAGAEYIVAADPTIIGVGTHTNATPLIYNGMTHTVIIDIHGTTTDFTVDMELDGGRVSITSDFEIDLPINAASAAATKQAEIARRLKEQQADAQLWASSFAIIGSVGQIATGAVALAGGEIAAGASQLVQGIGGIGSGIMAINRTNAERQALDAKTYATNAGTRCTKSAALNATRGFCQMKILPANSAEMSAAIDAQGYSVYYPTSALYPDAAAPADATLVTRSYDVLKYSFARVYGNIAEDLKESVRAILINGLRVWYTTPA